MSKTISIILPFYIVGNEFEAAIESIVAQSFPDWELLLISNNGNNKGLALATKWAEKDHRIRLIEEPEQGIAFALNTGHKYCEAPFIARRGVGQAIRAHFNALGFKEGKDFIMGA